MTKIEKNKKINESVDPKFTNVSHYLTNVHSKFRKKLAKVESRYKKGVTDKPFNL